VCFEGTIEVKMIKWWHLDCSVDRIVWGKEYGDGCSIGDRTMERSVKFHTPISMFPPQKHHHTKTKIQQYSKHDDGSAGMIDGDESSKWEYWDGSMGTGEWVWEHGDESMGKGEWGREHGMGLQRWKHEDTVGQIHNYKLYNLWDKYLKVQMDNLHPSVFCAMFE